MPFLNIDAADRTKSVFRIIPCTRFLQLIETQSNYLVHPRNWDDPFENFILGARGRRQDGTTFGFSFRNDVFAQSWSRHRETDLMWRGYSPDHDGVKLESTPLHLHNSLYEASDNFRDIRCFMGRVRYIKKHEVEEVLRNAHVADGTGRGIADTLLIKRFGFRSEAEVRLIYLSPNSGSGDGMTYVFHPNETITRAVLHPRMPAAAARKWRKQFAAAGLTIPVIQSGLYRRPKPFDAPV